MKTITDVVYAVSPLFGDYESDFDVDAIAAEMVEYDNGEYTFKQEYDPDSDEFDQDAVDVLLEAHMIR